MLPADLSIKASPPCAGPGEKLHLRIWTLALVLSIGIGAACNVSESRLTALPGRLSSWHAAIWLTVGDLFVGDRLLSRMVQLPEGRPVLIIYNKQHPHAQYAAQFVSYAAWPRPAVIKEAEHERVNVEAARDGRKYSAVILCDVRSDPPLPNAKRLSPKLEFIRGHE